MSDTVIKVENLSKSYIIRHQTSERYTALRDVLSNGVKSIGNRLFGYSNGHAETNREEFWALNDVSFAVKQGERVGIIGRNGAGKSTLLKILSRITEPTSGRIRIKGRVASLLEVGTGFHPELTGRENVYLNGAILGMGREEIRRKFDEIVTFAEVEKFLDTPVKRYSSGMYVRLAFAVAAHLEPDILVVDEVLAVGDATFQKKCLGKIEDVAKQGRTVLFVSHNMATMERLCEKAILLDSGSLVMSDDSHKTIRYYLETGLTASAKNTSLATRTDRSGNGKIRLTNFYIEDVEHNRLEVARSGMDIAFIFEFENLDKDFSGKVDIGFSLHTYNEQTLTVFYSSYIDQMFDVIPAKGKFRCVIHDLPLALGQYRVGARVLVGLEEADWPRNGVGFLEVEAGNFHGRVHKGVSVSAPLLLHGEWNIEESIMSVSQDEIL